MSTTYADLISITFFGASQLFSEAPPACQHPSASHTSACIPHPRHIHTTGGSAAARPAFPGPHGAQIFSLLTGYHHTIPSVCKGVFGPFLDSHSVTCLRLHVYKIEQYISANFGKLEKKSDVLTSGGRQCVVWVMWGEMMQNSSSENDRLLLGVFYICG